jgi:hypothetical protein
MYEAPTSFLSTGNTDIHLQFHCWVFHQIKVKRSDYLQDTRYIKYAEQKRNARNNRITVKYPA